MTDYNRDYYKTFEKWCDLCYSSSGELQFANMQISLLINALEEIEVLSTTPLISKIARNYIERNDLDKLAHASMLFRK